MSKNLTLRFAWSFFAFPKAYLASFNSVSMSGIVMGLVALVILADAFLWFHSLALTFMPLRRRMAVSQKSISRRGPLVAREYSTDPILSFRHFLAAVSIAAVLASSMAIASFRKAGERGMPYGATFFNRICLKWRFWRLMVAS